MKKKEKLVKLSKVVCDLYLTFNTWKLVCNLFPQ